MFVIECLNKKMASSSFFPSVATARPCFRQKQLVIFPLRDDVYFLAEDKRATATTACHQLPNRLCLPGACHSITE